MARIAYLLLCHKAAADIIRQVETLTSQGDFVAIHYDARGNHEEFDKLRSALHENPSVAFTDRRIRCGWGEWTLVRASLEAARTALENFPKASHLYLVSGDCMPIKPAETIHKQLDARDADLIESVDYYQSGWIKTGMREERLIYRHFVNERRNKGLFYALLAAQKSLGLSRAVPHDLDMMIGSQWWCLRRRTVEALLAFIAKRRDIVRFFRTTWIPDETFFQTLVRHLVPAKEIDCRSPTFLMFTDYGIPVCFHNDHYDLLLSQDYLFARKISPEAQGLKDNLTVLFRAPASSTPISTEGAALYSFLAGRGRVGRRYAPRFWDRTSQTGKDRELLVIVCKKWDVGKRLARMVHQETAMPAFGYLFNEEATQLPDLGGIQHGLDKRRRHAPALLRLLFDAENARRLVICLDPGDHRRLTALHETGLPMRVLSVACLYQSPYLQGHARRMGLLSRTTPPDRLHHLEGLIRDQIETEIEDIAQLGLPRLSKLSETSSAQINAQSLSEFLAVPQDTALHIAQSPTLFAD